MIAKAKAIPYGGNAVRYSVNKDRAQIVKVNHLPSDISAEAMWSRMLIHQAQFREKFKGRPLKNTLFRIEVSPTAEESRNWTMRDWEELADEFIREFDSIDLSAITKRQTAKSTNLRNSQYTVALHHDSRSGILHLHINANRIDMNGNLNDDHCVHLRAMTAVNNIARRRGWVQAEEVGERNRQEIADACMDILRNMPKFSWEDYCNRLMQRGYGIQLKKDANGIVRGYTVKKGNSTYKSSELGKGRKLMPSRIILTWTDLHCEAMKQSTAAPRQNRSSTTTKLQTEKTARCNEPPTVSVPSMRHHSFEFNYRDYNLDIPSAVDALISSQVILPDDNTFANIVDVQRTALLLFAGYLDTATQMSESCGGGGCAPDGWGRDKDEDDLEWARRCARMANRMCKAPVQKGLKR